MAEQWMSGLEQTGDLRASSDVRNPALASGVEETKSEPGLADALLQTWRSGRRTDKTFPSSFSWCFRTITPAHESSVTNVDIQMLDDEDHDAVRCRKRPFTSPLFPPLPTRPAATVLPGRVYDGIPFRDQSARAEGFTHTMSTASWAGAAVD